MNSMNLAKYAVKGNLKNYRKGTVFFVQRDEASKLFLIVEGIVKLSVYSALGEERITEFIKEGRFLGAPDFCCGLPYGITATAYTNVQMVAFSEEQVKELLGKDQEFSIGLANSLSWELRAMGQQLIRETFLPAIARIGLALQKLRVQIGKPVGDGLKVIIPITQCELAFFVGCNRVTVTKALNQMTYENLIAKKAKQIIIIDVDKLSNWLKETVQSQK